jgi:hypothetical protein
LTAADVNLIKRKLALAWASLEKPPGKIAYAVANMSEF